MPRRHSPQSLGSSTPLATWKEAADRLRQSARLDDDFDRQVQEEFRRAVVRCYWEPVYQGALQQCDISQADLASILGISRATVNRWDGDLVGRSGKKSIEPSLSSFLQILCAFQIERDCLPDGLSVTLDAYRQTFAIVFEAVRGVPPESDLDDAELMCLHFTCRSSRWLQAQLDGDADLLQEAAEEICSNIRRFVTASNMHTLPQVRETVERHIESWSVLETVILYEWFQSREHAG